MAYSNEYMTWLRAQRAVFAAKQAVLDRAVEAMDEVFAMWGAEARVADGPMLPNPPDEPGPTDDTVLEWIGPIARLLLHDPAALVGRLSEFLPPRQVADALDRAAALADPDPIAALSNPTDDTPAVVTAVPSPDTIRDVVEGRAVAVDIPIPSPIRVPEDVQYFVEEPVVIVQEDHVTANPIDTDDEPDVDYRCEKGCGYTTPYVGTMIAHEKQCTGNAAESQHVCDIDGCGKVFATAHRLHSHKGSTAHRDRGTKVYPCRKGCGQSWTHAPGRTAHERNCTGATVDPTPAAPVIDPPAAAETAWACEWADCTYVSDDRAATEAHEDCHRKADAGARWAFWCHACDETFGTYPELHDHQRDHTAPPDDDLDAIDPAARIAQVDAAGAAAADRAIADRIDTLIGEATLGNGQRAGDRARDDDIEFGEDGPRSSNAGIAVEALRCDDCTWTAHPSAIGDLIKHAILEHDRTEHKRERRPRLAVAHGLIG